MRDMLGGSSCNIAFTLRCPKPLECKRLVTSVGKIATDQTQLQAGSQNHSL
jgi:hypothetical protein